MSEEPQRRRANAPAADKSGGAGLKKFRVPIIIVAIAALVIGFNVAQAQGVFGVDEGCPGHWHSTLSVWDGDEKVSFNANGPAGSASSSPATGFHIHGDDGILHFHPQVERCTPLGDALLKMGVEVDDDSLTLAGDVREANDTYQVVVYHQEWQGDWEQVTDVDGFMEEQPSEGERIMIAYMANDSALTIEDRQGATADLTGGSYEPQAAGIGDEVFINISVTVIFAGLAIGIWYNFASKTW